MATCLVAAITLLLLGASNPLGAFAKVSCPSSSDEHPAGPTLLLVRHAQSANNAAWYRKAMFGLRDPELSSKGVEQARAASAALSGVAVDLVFSSQLQRAMQTAALIFPGPVHVAPFASETAITGRWCFLTPGICAYDRATQRVRLGPAMSAQFDWSLVGGPDGSNDDATMGPPSFSHFLGWLRNQTIVQSLIAAKGAEATIALVSHGNLLEHQALADCWPHPHNTQAFALTLPEGGKSVSLESVRVVYPGPRK
mmetsp:Transcript_50553/g.149140  ORF Transcript_50553/g.149140 Transcript_50553/m.149140 type:complete len:254 (+) Transcript_50553:38-799(+)